MRSIILILLSSFLLCSCTKNYEQNEVLSDKKKSAKTNDRIPHHGYDFKKDTSANRCKTCHEEQFKDWSHSQHANAMRDIGNDLDDKAFTGKSLIIYAKRQVEFLKKNNTFIIREKWEGKEWVEYKPVAVIGESPLIQYLIPFPGGRLQVFDFAYDPAKDEWFNVFGDEHRQTNEWGYWSNRGMNWNVQCADCHMTNLNKNYDVDTDSYQTSWEHTAITCKQCHKGTDDHMSNPHYKPTTENKMDGCASCHSVREDLTDGFHAGEKYDNHYRPLLADWANIYFEDGQVSGENFEYGSFIMSRMHHKGVTCLDCHDPHSAKLKLPADNNTLCLSCHQAPGQKEATVIDPIAHSHHAAGSEGGKCVSCHMPITTYMARDPRRDHGFTTPDPLLTKELNIPNACNRCHEDKDSEWSIKWTNEWYGDRMNRWSRERAFLVARAKSGDPGVVPELIKAFEKEQVEGWHQVFIGLLQPWVNQVDVQKAIQPFLQHENPLLRSKATQILGTFNSPDELERLKKDGSTAVRLSSLWSSRQLLANEAILPEEFQNFINLHSDQPEGALSQAELAMLKNDLDSTEAWLRKAVNWDQTSSYPKQMLAQILNMRNDKTGALEMLRAAGKIDPENIQVLYQNSLLEAELNNIPEAVKLLENINEVAPYFHKAWYNLGLIYSQQNRLEDSIYALYKAVNINPQDVQSLYALATVYYRFGNNADAQKYCMEVLTYDRTHEGAKQLLGSIMRPAKK